MLVYGVTTTAITKLKATSNMRPKGEKIWRTGKKFHINNIQLKYECSQPYRNITQQSSSSATFLIRHCIILISVMELKLH